MKNDPRAPILLELSDRALELLPPFFEREINPRVSGDIGLKCYFGSRESCHGLHWMQIDLYTSAHNPVDIVAKYEARAWTEHAPKCEATFHPTAQIIARWWAEVEAWAKKTQEAAAKTRGW